MSKYLIDDRPLIVLPKLAEKIGLNESLFLQQVHYWLLQKRHVRDGYYWTYNSYPKWLEQFPFWSESTLKRTVTSLENKGLIIIGNYNSMKIDKTKWYRIDYEVFKGITSDIEEFDGKASNDESVQNDPTNGSKRTDEDAKMNRPLPEITTENTTNNKDVKDISQQSNLPTKKVIKYDESSPYYGMAKYLYNKMLTNNPKAKEPNYQEWANDFRKIIELDKRDALEVKSIIDFSQNDSFWCSNILSPAKLRKQYDQLLIKMNQPKQQFNRGGYKQNEGFKRADDFDSFKARTGVDAPF